MRHRVAHRKLGRTTAHRLSLLRNLAISLIKHERIRTTLAKAKELRPFAEKLVTLGKQDSLHARRRALSIIPKKDAVAKLFNEVSPRFAERGGGYTRILKLEPRQGDGAPMAFIEFVDFKFAGVESKAAPAKESKKSKTKPDKEKEAPEAVEASAGEDAKEAKPKPAAKKKATKKKTTTKKTTTKKTATRKAAKKKATKKKTSKKT